MAPRGPEHLSSMASRVADVVITSYKGCAGCDAAPSFLLVDVGRSRTNAVPPEGRDDPLDVALPRQLTELPDTSAPGDGAEQFEGVAAQRGIGVARTAHHAAAVDAQRVAERFGRLDEPRRSKRQPDFHGVS